MLELNIKVGKQINIITAIFFATEMIHSELYFVSENFK